MNQLTINEIKETLKQTFSPSLIMIEDESHLHAGHAGSQEGKGHYALTISASAFKGLSRIKAHQLIYQSLDELFKTKIHALKIKIIQ